MIADSTKQVEHLVGSVPLELVGFGLASTIARLGSVTLRNVPESPDGGVIADWAGDLSRPEDVAELMSGTPGVVERGLFPPSMVSAVVIGRTSGAEWLERRT